MASLCPELAGAGGWGSSSPSGSWRERRVSTSGTWTRAHGAAYTKPRLHARPNDRGLLHLLRRRSIKGTSAKAGRPLRLSPTYPRLQELDAAFGEKAGWERANWFERNATGGDEGLRPHGLSGQALVARDRRRAPRLPRGGRALRRVVVRKARGLGRGRRRTPRTALRQPRRPRCRRDHLHADAEPAWRDRVRLHRHAPGRGALPDRHGHGLQAA